MSIEHKISPAFEPFLAESGPNDKLDAIVIYRMPVSEDLPTLSQLRSAKTRLSYVKTRARLQQAIQAQLFQTHQAAGAKRSPIHEEPAVATIGSGALPIATMEVTRKTLPALADQPSVIAILPNQRIKLIKPNDVIYGDINRQDIEHGFTWGLQQLEIPNLWAYSTGEQIKVAVLDTGVYGNHPALEGRVSDFVMIDPLGRRITTTPTFDAGQHGTHICGTIAGGKTPEGVSIGVAPGAELLVASVLIGDSTLLTLMEGISWAVEKGAHVLNLSLGFSYYEPLFAEIFDILTSSYGILPVVAIGNENHGNSSSPGNVHSAFAVGAVEKIPRSKTDVAPYSSGASLVFPGQKVAVVTKPDVVAPGTQVYSCIPPEKRPDGSYEYTIMDGTSMAAPHVAGVVALLMAAQPDAPLTDIIEALKQTAKHPAGDRYRPDNRWGYGLIQPLEAFKALKS